MNLSAVITGVAGYLPPDILTNHDLEKIVDTNDEWIRSRTGIEQRHILKDKDKAASDLVVEAMRDLLAKTNTNPDEVDLVICATVTGDMVFPDTANIACDKLGIKNAFGYDLNAACSGFLFGLTTGAQFIESGRYKKVIVVGVDVMSSILDYTDRTTCIIFGDGCGAVMLEPSEDLTIGYQDAILRGDGSGRKFLRMKSGGSLSPATMETVLAREHYVYQEGKTVFKFAVKGMISAVEDLLEKNNMTIDDVDWLVPHQANKRIIDVVGRSLKIPVEKVMMNIQKYGNTTAATIPLCLWDYESQLKKGDKVVLTSFGGGFTWGAILLTWGI